MLLDVSRPLGFDEGNDNNAVSIDYDANLWLAMTYGVFNDKGHRDGGRVRGDKDTGKAQGIKVLNNAYYLTIASATAAVAVASSLY